MVDPPASDDDPAEIRDLNWTPVIERPVQLPIHGAPYPREAPPDWYDQLFDEKSAVAQDERNGTDLRATLARLISRLWRHDR